MMKLINDIRNKWINETLSLGYWLGAWIIEPAKHYKSTKQRQTAIKKQMTYFLPILSLRSGNSLTVKK